MERTNTNSFFKLDMKTLTSIVVLLAMCIFLAIVSENFRTINNILSITLQSSINAILALGVLVPIIIGGTDLSVGSVLAFAGMCMAMAIGLFEWPTSLLDDPIFILIFIVILLIPLLIGGGIGFVNGVIISKMNLAPFIVTLGMMSIARGLTLVISEGKPISGMPNAIRMIAKTKVVGIPFPVIIATIMLIITAVLLKYTRWGRTLYAIGGNEEATRLSGINVNRAKILAFTWCGSMAGLSGILLTARLNSAQSVAGIGYELDAISAVVIGGASLSGGQGTALGTVIGALIMGVLRNGLNLLSIEQFWQQVFIGVVLIAAVAFDSLRNSKNA